MSPGAWTTEEELQYDVDQRGLSYGVSDRVKMSQKFEPATGQKNSRRSRYEKRRGAGAKSHNGVHRRRQKHFAV